MDHKRRKMLTSYKIWKLEKMGINNIITWKPKYIGHVKRQSDLERTAMKDVVLGRRVRTEMDTGQWRHFLFWGVWDGTDNQSSLLGWPWCVASCEGLTSWWRVARLNIPQGKSEKVWVESMNSRVPAYLKLFSMLTLPTVIYWLLERSAVNEAEAGQEK